MVQQEFSEYELNAIFQALSVMTIQGKDARNIANLIDKVASGINYIKGLKLEEERKKLEELQQIKSSKK
jgi:hypothetical protein